MKPLIAEDKLFLAEISAEFLRSLDRHAQFLEAIMLGSDLTGAILCLPERDAALTDDAYPLTRNSRFVVASWDGVRQKANRRDMRFILYGGSLLASDRARPARPHWGN